MTHADKIREHVYRFHIRPALGRGDPLVEVRAGDIHRELQYQNRMPLVCSALGGRKLLGQYSLELVDRRGPKQGANVYFTYKAATSAKGQLPAPASTTQAPGPLPAASTRTARSSPISNNRHLDSVDVALVACVSMKRDHASAAKDLYVSPWFLKARHFVEQLGCNWYILSAKHGLISPETHIEPYDVTLIDAGVQDRRRWSEQVLSQILEVAPPSARICFLAGQRYREFLVAPLQEAGMDIQVPMEGLAIGQQLSWLSIHG